MVFFIEQINQSSFIIIIIKNKLFLFIYKSIHMKLYEIFYFYLFTSQTFLVVLSKQLYLAS